MVMLAAQTWCLFRKITSNCIWQRRCTADELYDSLQEGTLSLQDPVCLFKLVLLHNA